MWDSKSGSHCWSCKQRKRLCKKKLSWNLHKSQEISKMDQAYHREKRKIITDHKLKYVDYTWAAFNQINVTTLWDSKSGIHCWSCKQRRINYLSIYSFMSHGGFTARNMLKCKEKKELRVSFKTVQDQIRENWSMI